MRPEIKPSKWDNFLYFSESSPSLLRSATQRGPVNKDAATGWQRQDGYWLVGVDGKNVLAHRIIYEMFYGDIPVNYQIDHIDGNCRNNSPEAQ